MPGKWPDTRDGKNLNTVVYGKDARACDIRRPARKECPDGQFEGVGAYGGKPYT